MKSLLIPALLLATFLAVVHAADGDKSGPHGYGDLRADDIPLMRAIKAGDLALVKRLVAEGEDVDVRTFNGMTLMHRAAAYGRSDILRYLIGIGADVDSRMLDGITPLFIAVERQDTNAVNILLRKDASYDFREIALAIHRGRMDILRALVRSPRHANMRDLSGMTPLHVAAQAGRLEMARFLVEKGARPDARDAKNQTPLDVAISSKEMIERQLPQGVGAEQLQELRKNGIDYAGYDPLIDFLRQRGPAPE